MKKKDEYIDSLLDEIEGLKNALEENERLRKKQRKLNKL